MAHIPHLFLQPPWRGRAIDLSASQLSHLFKVLRLQPGSEISYTDGRGLIGSGELTSTQVIRGEETAVSPPIDLEVAVAPPHERDRIRFLVEKAAELEVRRIRWLRSRFGNARPNQIARAEDWAVGALEQSRGGWLTAVDRAFVGTDDLEGERATVVADPSGDRFLPPPPLRVVVGPEGGWAEKELPTEWPRLSLGRRVLRTETAVVVAVLAVSSYSTNFAGD
jgi:16S rRNA (uracil1498-N3)-methyltransferase